jgi:hypothetical protein
VQARPIKQSVREKLANHRPILLVVVQRQGIEIFRKWLGTKLVKFDFQRWPKLIQRANETLLADAD